MNEPSTTDERTDENRAETTILAVDDEPLVAEAYALWLSEYTVHTAMDGESALSQLDETVDIVLLDRQMPDLSGDEVLERIRERGHDCRVAMVTGTEPDFDTVEMGFDTYITKPVDRDALRETVSRLVGLSSYDEDVMEYFALAQKRAALDAEKNASERAASPEYTELVSSIRELKGNIDANVTGLNHCQFVATFEELPDHTT